jgi:hypothetical protein
MVVLFVIAPRMLRLGLEMPVLAGSRWVIGKRR